MADGHTVAASEAVKKLTLGLRDSKQVLSRILVGWLSRAPSLETNITLAALAQEELGHAQVLAGIYTRNFADDLGPDDNPERISLNEPISHPLVKVFDHKPETWPDVIGLLCLWDTAVATMLESLATSSFEPLQHVSGKMCQEEANHWLFARGQSSELIARGGKISERLRDRCATLLPDVNLWFHKISDMSALRQQGVVDDGLALAAFATKVGPILEDLDLDWPAAPVGAAS